MKSVTAKQLAKLHDEAVRALAVRDGDLNAPVDRLLAALATLPYGGNDGKRERLEVELLDEARPRGRFKKTGPLARRIWTRLVTDWSAAGPVAGEENWWYLARAQRECAAKLPARLRATVRAAWASGRVRAIDKPDLITQRIASISIERALDRGAFRL